MQTSYLIEHVAGYEGDLADSGPHIVLPLRNNGSAEIPFGRAIVHDAGTGTSDLAGKVIDTKAQPVLGVSIRSAARAIGPTDGSGANGVRANDMFDVISHGQVLVVPEEAIVAGDDVYVRFGPGTAEDASCDVAGKFRTSTDSHTAWAKKTAYTKGQRRYLSNKVYQCITAGTSEDSDTPALIGSTSSDATDGTAHWKYLGACGNSGESVDALPGARFLGAAAMGPATGAAAGALAVMEVNLPQ